MLKGKIQETRTAIIEKTEERKAKLAEARQLASEGKLEEARSVKESVAALKDAIEKLEVDLKDLEELDEEEEEEVEETEERTNKKGEKRNMSKQTRKLIDTQKEGVRSFVEFVQSRGEKRDGIVSNDIGVIIPEDISYNPDLEVKTTVDLSTLINKVPVKHPTGKYPVRLKATTGMLTKEELAKIPENEKPAFTDVMYDVDTYATYLPISTESIEDSVVDLEKMLAEFLQEEKIITINRKVGDVLKSFTRKTITSPDDIKDVFNVDLDPAYVRTVVVNQIAFNDIDKLKDAQGRYLLKDDITTASGKSLLGAPVVILPNHTFSGGTANQTKGAMWVGDLKKGVFNPERRDITAQWVDNTVYGKALSVIYRADFVKADADAGFYAEPDFSNFSAVPVVGE